MLYFWLQSEQKNQALYNIHIHTHTHTRTKHKYTQTRTQRLEEASRAASLSHARATAAEQHVEQVLRMLRTALGALDHARGALFPEESSEKGPQEGGLGLRLRVMSR